MKQDRPSDVVRLLKWIHANVEDWDMICGSSGNDLPLSECVRLIKIMRDEEFYEVIVFMLYSNYLTGIVGDLLLDKVMGKWTKKDIGGLINLIIEALMLEEGRIIPLQEIRKYKDRQKKT